MKARTRYLVFSIITLVLFFGAFVGVLILSFFDHSEDFHALHLVLHILTPVFSLGFTALFFRYISLSISKKTLIRENLYNFGEATEFFDLNAFQLRVSVVSKTRFNRKKKQYIVAFSAANQSVMQNLNRDESVNSFNATISHYLDNTFIKNSKSKRKNNIFCFNRGIFLIYCFDDEEHTIRQLVNDISDNLFRIAEENQVRIWVQPFFGVAEFEKGVSIIETIENAMVARNVSERNFEVLTYYHESFRRRSSKSDIEEITNGLKNHEFVVYYQPKFSLSSKRFVSSEALVRWDSKKYGLLPPSKFIPLAEAAGLIHEIDTYVFEKVCEDLNEAKRKGRRIIPVSINFSLYEFYSSDFLNSVLNLLDKYKINPSYIEIEVTEATSQANTFVSISIIKKLRDRGIRVLMDDFGVGFSNIGNLRKIPFDAVKIDKSFIDDIATDMKSRAIVKFLIELCQANDLEVIAEGVDNKEQVDILRKYKCNTIQGFYYSQALPIKEYEKFLFSNPFERKEGADL